MKELLRDWDYKKHACAVTGLYILISLIGNLVLGTCRSLEKTKGKPLAKRVHKLSRREKIFNGALLGCYLFDMTATYQLLRWVRGKLLNQQLKGRNNL